MHHNLIEHLSAFIAIAEASSFSQGARQLRCSVSSMSYSLAKLEEQCGFALLKRGGGPTELTPRGRALFREAKALLQTARNFTAHAAALQRGEEARIRLAVDVAFPHTPLLEVLYEFAARHAHVTLQLFSTSLNQLWEQLQSGAVDFGIAPLCNVPAEIEAKPFTSIDLVPFASKDHPLGKRKERLSLSEMRRYRQLYYVGSPHLDLERSARIFATDFWTANDLTMLRVMIKRGVGWGFGTPAFFHEELMKGEVVRLDCPDLQAAWPVGFVWRMDCPPGPLARELINSSLVERGVKTAPARLEKTA